MPTGSIYGGEYTYNYSNAKDKILIDENGETVKIDTAEKEVTLKNTFFQYMLTTEQKNKIGSCLSRESYWLASCLVECSDQITDVAYHVIIMNWGNIQGTRPSFGIYNTGERQFEDTANRRVCAVVCM